MKKSSISILICLILIVTATVIAENTSNENTTINETTLENTTQNTTEPPVLDEVPEEVPEENITPEQIVDFTITNFIPKEFKIGDVQLNIQVKNTGNTELGNLVAVVSGKGFSTYDVVGIDYLKPDTNSYILVTGNFRERGDITLTIRINNKIFYQNVTVIDPSYVDDQQRLKDLQEAEEARKKSIAELQTQLDNLDKKYTEIENDLKIKKKENYDVADVSLVDLKNLLRNADSNIIKEDVTEAKANLQLASDEYTYQKNKLDNSKKITKSFFDKIKENLILISSIAASIVTLFAFMEIMKKKKESLSKKVMEVKVTLEKKKKEEAPKEDTESKDKKKPKKEQKKK